MALWKLTPSPPIPSLQQNNPKSRKVSPFYDRQQGAYLFVRFPPFFSFLCLPASVPQTARGRYVSLPRPLQRVFGLRAPQAPPCLHAHAQVCLCPNWSVAPRGLLLCHLCENGCKQKFVQSDEKRRERECV
eukprot:TRINITY_DN10415_c0_g1_i1.p2 TRINITY_DN10415_c0_g1~~TRINITY_DN10415_c0_g1_i1.p2  ORF type:complete len:131 (+),score=3.19 TRINITY_DN10415_c0_g1_i1:241-633(+)